LEEKKNAAAADRGMAMTTTRSVLGGPSPPKSLSSTTLAQEDYFKEPLANVTNPWLLVVELANWRGKCRYARMSGSSS
jgi:hypothetical protein